MRKLKEVKFNINYNDCFLLKNMVYAVPDIPTINSQIRDSFLLEIRIRQNGIPLGALDGARGLGARGEGDVALGYDTGALGAGTGGAGACGLGAGAGAAGEHGTGSPPHAPVEPHSAPVPPLSSRLTVENENDNIVHTSTLQCYRGYISAPIWALIQRGMSAPEKIKIIPSFATPKELNKVKTKTVL